MSSQEQQLQIFKVGDAYGVEDFYHAWNGAQLLEEQEVKDSDVHTVEPRVIGKAAVSQNVVP